jgi:phenylacetate-CoA ligase
VRLAVYCDLVYRRADDGTLTTDEAFALFAARLADVTSRLVLIGRIDPAPGPLAHRLPPGAELAGLPHYEDLSGARSPLALARSLGRLWRALDDVDVVWLLGPHPLGLVLAALALARRRRVALGVRQDLPAYVRSRRPGRRGLLAAALALEGAWRLLARACPVVVVGPDLARRYRRARRLADISISLIDEQDLVSPEQALERIYDGDLVALSVGRLDAEKNPLLLADALAALRRRDPRWRLVICGDGALRGELAERLVALGVDGHAELAGHLPMARLHDAYRSSHALLHVSWTEGFPQVLIEAFAAGLPVVATDVGGVAAVAGDAASLIPPGDAEAAGAAVAEVGADAALRERLVRRALARAREHTAGAAVRRLACFLSDADGGPTI